MESTSSHLPADPQANRSTSSISMSQRRIPELEALAAAETNSEISTDTSSWRGMNNPNKDTEPQSLWKTTRRSFRRRWVRVVTRAIWITNKYS